MYGWWRTITRLTASKSRPCGIGRGPWLSHGLPTEARPFIHSMLRDICPLVAHLAPDRLQKVTMNAVDVGGGNATNSPSAGFIGMRAVCWPIRWCGEPCGCQWSKRLAGGSGLQPPPRWLPSSLQEIGGYRCRLAVWKPWPKSDCLWHTSGFGPEFKQER